MRDWQDLGIGEHDAFCMSADPKPEVSVRHSHGRRAVAAAETHPPIAPALLKAKRAVAGIFHPETIGFASGGASFRRERGVGPPEFRVGQGFHPAAFDTGSVTGVS